MFFHAVLVSKTCKGTWFCCLDPHRRASPTQRTTRYSVFKERPRSWELVENSPRRSIRTYLYRCIRPTRGGSNIGRNPSASHPATGAGTYATPACRSRGFLSPLEGFLQTRGERDLNVRSTPNPDSSKTPFPNLDQLLSGFEDASRVRKPLSID